MSQLSGRLLINPYYDLFQELSAADEALRLAVRKKLIWAYSWAVPSGDAVATLAELGPIVELGAGTGYWAWLLAQLGVDVLALDHEEHQPPRWLDVQRGDELALERMDSRRALFLCWPPLDSSMAARALELFRGERVAYAGEWRGRTADLAFHDRLEEAFRLEAVIPLPNWPGFRDELRIYRRRGQRG